MQTGSTIRRAGRALLLFAPLLVACPEDSNYVEIVEDNPVTDGFDFPVAPGEMDGWVEPPPPGETFDPSSYLVHREDGIHAAVDFFKENDVSAAGHELWAIGDGVVVDIVYDREAYPDKHDGGDRDAEWGNLILIQHDYLDDGANKRVWSQYAHCQTIEVELGDVVARDQRIGAVGKTDGVAGTELWDKEHLHFETRITNFKADAYPKDMGLTTDAQIAEHYVHPLEFIRAHRPSR
jgi:murein DD-endopeptidase MepM/ murein hydrolase activator NlpD